MTTTTISARARTALAGGAAALALILTGVAPFSATLAYAAGDDYTQWEDCDWDGYDDHTGVKVPWPGFDGTKGDTPAGPSENSQTGQKLKPKPTATASTSSTATTSSKPSSTAKASSSAKATASATSKASTKAVASAAPSESATASASATNVAELTAAPTPSSSTDAAAAAASDSSDPSLADAYSAGSDGGNPELVIGLSVLGGLAGVAGLGAAGAAFVRRRASA
jgi:CCR4-NOT transcriptional regulation complex, NOT5 subunit